MAARKHRRPLERFELETPQALFDALNEEFLFTIDVCATDTNHKCHKYFTQRENGLVQPWQGVCWCSPPQGNIDRWLAKACMEASFGVTVVCFLPARTDTAWWWRYCLQAHEIRFIQGWVRFSGTAGPTPYPSAVVVFRGSARKHDAPEITWWSNAPGSTTCSIERAGPLRNPRGNGSPMATWFTGSSKPQE